MKLTSSHSFAVGEEEYRFEIMDPVFTRRPLQLLNERSGRLEDRFHRTIKITRLRDSRSWTGAADIESWYMNDLQAYVRRWLEDCFVLWDTNAIPDGFEIPQGALPRDPVKHHCPEFPIALDRIVTRADTDDSGIVDTASEQSFPASDAPEWTGLSIP